MERELIVTMIGMAVILYVMRIAGYALISRTAPSPMLDAWLSHIPGATLVALIVPMIVHEGVIGLLAGTVVWLIVWRTDNIVLSMIAGVAIVGVLG
jgi:uncharacterized membrane protein